MQRVERDEGMRITAAARRVGAASRAAPAVLLLVVAVTLAGCAGMLRSLDPAEREAARYVSDTPPEIALFTVILADRGVHSALMVNGDHRVVYDPAGGWRDRDGLSDGDLRYAMTPPRLARYLNYNTRRGRQVIIHRRPVPPEVANRAIEVLEEQRPFPSGFCSFATGRVLAALPGFEGITRTFAPRALMRAFAAQGDSRVEILDADGIRVATPEERAQAEEGASGAVPPPQDCTEVPGVAG